MTLFMQTTLPFLAYILCLLGIAFWATSGNQYAVAEDCCEVDNYAELTGLQQIRHNED